MDLEALTVLCSSHIMYLHVLWSKYQCVCVYLVQDCKLSFLALHLQSDVDKVALEEELAFVSRRMKEYEMGEYGLGEAVAEIKRRTEETALRDR